MRKEVFSRMLVLLVVSCMSIVAFSQSRKVMGTVTDDKQLPLVGATVSVKGTKVSTTTDAVGKFSLTVPDNATTLVISYVGMQNREAEITSNGVVNAALSPTAGTLTDVVVIGYGSTRKANLTTAQT